MHAKKEARFILSDGNGKTKIMKPGSIINEAILAEFLPPEKLSNLFLKTKKAYCRLSQGRKNFRIINKGIPEMSINSSCFGEKEKRPILAASIMPTSISFGNCCLKIYVEK